LILYQAIGRVWANERAEFINKLKQRQIGSSTLVGTDYHLNVMMGENNLTKLQDLTVLFEFTLTSGNEQVPDLLPAMLILIRRS
jgi:hypothetical protein